MLKLHPTTHTHTVNYPRVSNITYFEMIATHRYSPLQTGGGYHVLVLTSEYASYIRKLHVYTVICLFCVEIRLLGTKHQDHFVKI